MTALLLALVAFVPVESFDSGPVRLVSYSAEDIQPDSWRLDTVRTADSTPRALALFGNCWKLESIAARPLDSGDVWQVACFVESLGEIHGFGLCDSARTLFYALAGSEQLDPAAWMTVLQGAFPLRRWNRFELPVGRDWLARFGYLPRVTGLVFVNDKDAGARPLAWFDEVRDVTRDQPVAPLVEIWHEETGRRFVAGALAVTVRFHSRVTDPDSPRHDYAWNFGDGGTSADSAPAHTYVVRDAHAYSVLLEVADSTGRRGRARDTVTVDPGPSSLPVRLNFIGDIMLARRYERRGGVIDTLGLDGIFAPTRPLLGDAADITVANLESPLTDEGTRHPTKPIVFRGRPENVAGLAFAGIDVVSLANNHVIDYGLEGMRETQRLLDSCGIRHSGAGAEENEAWQPLFVSRAGLTFAFIAASDRTGQYDNLQPYLNAGPGKPGFAEQDTWRLFRLIQECRRVADVVIIELHAGEEYNPVPLPEAQEEWYSPRPYPLPGDRQLRRRLIENGADAVIVHHAHLLQGFELAAGRLIAHNLGDFTFDLDYPECYPTVILSAAADERGLGNWRVTPAYIDDYVPLPATSELGAAILDDLARRSRDLGAWLLVNRESLYADIPLDTTAIPRWTRRRQLGLELIADSAWRTSRPARIDRTGCITAVTAPGPGWQARAGRQLLWWGNMEDEGASLWQLTETGERFDTAAARGRRSLRQLRAPGAGAITTGLEERPPIYNDTADYSLCATVRTEDAAAVTAILNCYAARDSGSPLGSRRLDTIAGTTPWTPRHRDFTIPTGTGYYDIVLTSRGPAADTGRAWFDDVALVEWDDWQSLAAPLELPLTNDYSYLQLRTAGPDTLGRLEYEETGFFAAPGIAAPALVPPGPARLTVNPNPTRGPVLISCPRPLGSSTPPILAIFDAAGRRRLVRRLDPAVAGQLALDLSVLPPGAYFVRLAMPDRTLTTRLIRTD